MTLKGPPGPELIYALVTLKPIRFIGEDFSRSSEVFHAVTRGIPILTRDINAVAKNTPLREQAKAMLELEVLRKALPRFFKDRRN